MTILTIMFKSDHLLTQNSVGGVLLHTQINLMNYINFMKKISLRRPEKYADKSYDGDTVC